MPVVLRSARDDEDQPRLDCAFNPREFGERLTEVLRREERRPVVRIADEAEGKEETESIWALQHAPFEWLSLDGHPAGDRAVFARHVSRKSWTPCRVPPGKIPLLDLWGGADENHPLAGVELDITLGAAAGTTQVLATDPASYPALVVFAHGTEDADHCGRPFLTEDGHPWCLPTENRLPRLVILLACGTDGGNLIEYGRSLLDHGAQTVIAPYGRLGAWDARGFLKAFMNCWLDGARADVALLEARKSDASGWGARRLVIVGEPGLRCSDASTLDDHEVEALVTICLDPSNPQRDAAAVLLAERATLDAFQRRSIFESERQLDSVFGIAAEPAKRQEFLALYDAVLDRTGDLTKAWLAAKLAGLVEERDHEKLGRYEQFRDTLSERDEFAYGRTYHYWNRLHYRRGEYAKCLELLIRGLKRVGADQFRPHEHAPLLRSLANLLIEADLPDAALDVVTSLDDAFQTADAKTTESGDERYKLHDTHARAHLRFGQRDGRDGWIAALYIYRMKREEASKRGESGYRELAWILYLYAWGDPDGGRECAKEVWDVLECAERRRALHEPRGNDDEWYLLRAYAAWGWAANDAEAMRRVGSYRPLVKEVLVKGDPGATGFVIGFLCLHSIDAGISSAGSTEWERDWIGAREMLHEKRYYLEAAGFDALLGRVEEAQKSLERYQNLNSCLHKRLEALTDIAGVSGVLGGFARQMEKWVREAQVRTALEQRVLSGKASRCELLSSGLLPF